MSFPDAFAPDMVLGPDQVLPTVPRDFGERFDLNWKAARAPDKWFFYENRMRALYDEALDRLRKATGQSHPNPFHLLPGRAPTMEQTGEFTAPPRQREDVLPEILAAFDKARAEHPDIPNPRLFEDTIRAEATKLRQDAAKSALASYGAGGLGAFLGAAAGEVSHPVNLATLPLGGSYALTNIARVGLLRYLGRNALAEAGVAMASQTAIEVLDAPYQERLGTDTGLADRLERIFIAGAGGAILGLGLSGLVAAARGLRRRLPATLDEADALKVAERATLQEGKSPLGPDGANAHAAALNRAESAVAAGRHANVDEIVREEAKRQVGARPASATADMAAPGASAAARAAEPEGTAATAALEFTTAKGSTYSVEGGTTIRNKAERLEHGADKGIKERSESTVYVSAEAKEALGVKGLEGRWMVAKFNDGTLGVTMFNEAKQAWGMSPSARVPFETEPAVGLHPVEVWGGTPGPSNSTVYPKMHVGNSITEVRRASPAQSFDILDPAPARMIAGAAPVPPEKAAATVKAEAELFNARSIAEDPNVKTEIKITEDGRAMSPREALEAADEEAKMARQVESCAKGFVL